MMQTTKAAGAAFVVSSLRVRGYKGGGAIHRE